MIVEHADVYDWIRIIRRCDLSAKGLAASTADHIALVLASFANKDGTRIFPGISLISKCAKVGEKTVRRVLTRLRDLGLILRVSSGSRHGQGYADEYRLTFPADLPERVPMLGPDMVPAPVTPPVTMTGGLPEAEHDTATPGDNPDGEPGDNPPPRDSVPRAKPGASGHTGNGHRSSDDQPHNHLPPHHRDIPPTHFGDLECDQQPVAAVENHSGNSAVGFSGGAARRASARGRTSRRRRRTAKPAARRTRHLCTPTARPPPSHAPHRPSSPPRTRGSL